MRMSPACCSNCTFITRMQLSLHYSVGLEFSDNDILLVREGGDNRIGAISLQPGLSSVV